MIRPARLLPALLLPLSLGAQNPARIDLVPWTPSLGPVVDIAHCNDSRLFIVRQQGIISIVTDSNTVQATPFLDIQGPVLYAGEQGLLGMTFDPDYANNGFFYVHYTAGSGAGISTISRFSVSSDSSVADPGSEQILYTWVQPFANHNGGDLDFGPDGMLYVGFGDGGSGGDPQNNAQDPTDPLGNMIRIDVSDPDTTWTVPPDNPFVAAGSDTLPEIWASGLRNPFRFGFDRLTGDIWIGDVGQSSWEEVDFWPAGDNSGPNFGWRCYEGFAPYTPGGCLPGSFYVDPVVVQVNDGVGGEWCSMIGGRVYRGSIWPHLYGRYFYTDYCKEQFRNLRPDGSGGFIDELSMTPTFGGFTSVGENVDGELFVTSQGTSRVYKIIDRCPMDPPTIDYDGTTLSSSLAPSYQWYRNNVPVAGAIGQTYIPTASGDYFVVGNFGNGCLLNSDTLFAAIIGVPEFEVPTMLLAPNPAATQVDIIWTNATTVNELLLTDMEGRLLEAWDVRERDHRTLDVTSLAAGHYVLQLRARGGAVLVAQRLSIMR